jgi:hypothetical protein
MSSDSPSFYDQLVDELETKRAALQADEGLHFEYCMRALEKRGVTSIDAWKPEPECEEWIDAWYPSGADTIERVAGHNVAGELGAATRSWTSGSGCPTTSWARPASRTMSSGDASSISSTYFVAPRSNARSLTRGTRSPTYRGRIRGILAGSAKARTELERGDGMEASCYVNGAWVGAHRTFAVHDLASPESLDPPHGVAGVAGVASFR